MVDQPNCKIIPLLVCILLKHIWLCHLTNRICLHCLSTDQVSLCSECSFVYMYQVPLHVMILEWVSVLKDTHTAFAIIKLSYVVGWAKLSALCKTCAFSHAIIISLTSDIGTPWLHWQAGTKNYILGNKTKFCCPYVMEGQWKWFDLVTLEAVSLPWLLGLELRTRQSLWRAAMAPAMGMYTSFLDWLYMQKRGDNGYLHVINCGTLFV